MRGPSGKLKLRHKVLVDAAREALVGLIFALLVAPLIFCVTGQGHLTLDWSQRVYFLTDRPGGALGTHGEARAAPVELPKAWAFVDLHSGFCEGQPGANRCPPDGLQTDHGALAKLLLNVLKDRPRLVVLDVFVRRSLDAAEDASLLSAIRGAQSPVLVSWLPKGGTADAPTLNALSNDLLFPMAGTGLPRNARYLPAVKAMDGPTARYLKPMQAIALPDGTKTLPTLAFGAAILLASPTNDPFKHFDSDPAQFTGSTCGPLHHGACRDYFTTQRVFSFPRRSPHDDEPYVGSHNDPFFARILPDMGDPFLDRLAPGSLRDAVVVIGNSSYEAGDQSWSALGDVSGAEIVLNDIRQYLTNPPEPERGFFLNFLICLRSEIWFYLIGCLSIFVSEVVISSRWPGSRNDAARAGELGGVAQPSGHAAKGDRNTFTWRDFGLALLKLGLQVAISLALFVVSLQLFFPRLTDLVSPFFGSLAQAVVETLACLRRALDVSFERLFEKHKSSEPAKSKEG